MCSLDISGSASRSEAFPPPPPPLPSADLSCLPVRLGRNSPDSSGVRHFVLGGVLGPYQLPRTQGSVPGPEVSRGSCLRSVSSGSFRQRNSRVLYQFFREVFFSPSLCLIAIELWEWCFQRGIHLSATHFPGVVFLVADFLFRGKFLPSEWSLNPLVFQRFYQVFSSLSGDRSVCVHHQF